MKKRKKGKVKKMGKNTELKEKNEQIFSNEFVSIRLFDC